MIEDSEIKGQVSRFVIREVEKGTCDGKKV